MYFKGETIIEEALVQTVRIEEKPEETEKQEKNEGNSISKNLVKSVNWIGQSTIQLSNHILPSQVTSVISSTISLTGSGIQGT